MSRPTAWIALAGLVVFGTPAAQAQQQAQQTVEEPQLIIPQAPLAPGGEAPVWQKSPLVGEFDGKPDMIEAGKQLYAAMNCVGCHAHGGGGMGPGLMERPLRYGSSIEHIVSSIREGRPNGMPSFRGFLPDEQIWQIAAYVRSLSETPATDPASGKPPPPTE